MGSSRKSTNCDEGFIKPEVFNFPIWGGNNRFHPDTSIKSWEGLMNPSGFRNLKEVGEVIVPGGE